MKKYLVLLLSLCLLLSFAACGSQEVAAPAEEIEEAPAEEAVVPAEPVAATVMALKGPTGIGMVQLMDNADATALLTEEFSIAASPDEIVAALSSGEAQIAACPTNLAAKLYNKLEGDLVMLGVNTYGTLYLLENGETLQSLADLEGQTLYATGQGANPQYVLEYLLRENGLEPGVDLEIVWLAEHAELATMMAGGDVTYAMLPEPNATSVLMNNQDVRIALSFNDLWEEATGSQLTMGCVVADRAFAEENPEAVAEFLTALSASIEFAVNDPAAAGLLCETYGVIPKAKLAEAAIPHCNLTLITGAELEVAVTPYLAMLHAADPAAIGGTLPDAAFYYTGE